MTDPRIRERRVEVARELGRSRRRRIVVVAAVISLVTGGFALVHSSLFGARDVHVTGDAHTSSQAIVRAAGLEGSPPLIDLDAGAIARKVERLPWIATAKVSISWPSTVSIAVTERIPVAAVKLGAKEGYALCDPTGRVLEDVARRPSSLPVLEVRGKVGRPGGYLGSSAALAAVAADMPESMVRLTADIFVSPAGAEIRLTDGIAALLGSTTSLGQKFVALATVLDHGGLTGVGEIDLRVPNSPVLIRSSLRPIVPASGGG